MAISFSRSRRAMNNDTFRPSLFGMSIFGIALAIWVGWFAVARVPLTATSLDAQLQRDGTIIAHFSADQIARIKPGQDATVRVQASAQNYRARVSDVANPTYNRMEANTARVYVQASELPQGTLQIEIVIDQISPLALILQRGVQSSNP